MLLLRVIWIILEKDKSKYRTLQMPNPIGDNLYCCWPDQFITVLLKSGEYKTLDERTQLYEY